LNECLLFIVILVIINDKTGKFLTVLNLTQVNLKRYGLIIAKELGK